MEKWKTCAWKALVCAPDEIQYLGEKIMQRRKFNIGITRNEKALILDLGNKSSIIDLSSDSLIQIAHISPRALLHTKQRHEAAGELKILSRAENNVLSSGGKVSE